MSSIGISKEDGANLGLLCQLRHVDVVVERVLGVGVVAGTGPLAGGFVVAATCCLEEVQVNFLL